MDKLVASTKMTPKYLLNEFMNDDCHNVEIYPAY